MSEGRAVMYTVTWDQLQDACDRAGLEYESAIYPAYSGRAMYGDTCLGLTHDSTGALLVFVAALVTAHGEPHDIEWLDRARQDSMGLDTITYWPGVTIEEES